MENEGRQMPSFFGFVFILHVEGVGGVATNAHKHVIIVGEGYYELIVISCVPLVSLFGVLFTTTRFEYLICSCTLAACPLW